MIEEILTWLTTALYENVWIALFSAFGWGVLSILLSPCHLSSIPLIVGFISSLGKINAKRTFLISLVFATGILITIALIGLITASLGRILGDVGKYGNYFVAVVFFIVGLYLLDFIKLPWDEIKLKKTPLKGLPAALLMGLLFGIGLGPCTFAFMAPVLGVVFDTARSNIIYSISLLGLFSIGHISVIVLAGNLTNKVQRYLDWSEDSKAIIRVRKICGILVFAGGIYLIYSVN